MAQNRGSGAKVLVITCVKGEGSFLKFWALPESSLETVKNFEARFIKKAPELDSGCGFVRSEQIPVGSKCAVKSKIKKLWCRARVLCHHNFTNVVVQLMDYGNEEVIPVADVRNVDDQIFAISPQALECILADVIPTRGTDWLPEAIRFCEQHLLYCKVSCYVVSEYMKLPIVRIAKKGENEPFVQRLINSGLAYIKDERVSPPPVAMPSYKVNNMDQNTVHLVKVCFIESAHKFYVQLSAAEMELKHLMDAINRLPIDTLTGVKLPAVHTPCLAQLSTKPCYYRAVITYVQQSRCKVFFVDYGFYEFKDLQELRAIPPVYLNLPAQAICCSLPRDANIDLDEFRRLSTFEHLECHVLHRTTESYVVKLLRRGQNLTTSPQIYTNQKLSIGTTCDVTVSYVNDLSEFYIQLAHLKDQQNAISTILNSDYKFVPIPFAECTPGRAVCVTYSEDNMWYRAQIVKVNHENDIEVFFVDFGNFDNVNLSDVRRMSPELLKFPVQAFKCHLYKTPIPPESKAKDEAFDLFEELTTEQCLVAHIKEYTEESGYGVALVEKNSSVSINEKVLLTIMSVPNVPLNDIENMYITSFDSANSFFAQLEKLDSDKLEQMQEEINTFYSSTQNSSFIPKVGNLVCARFNVDDQFYRARVDKCKDGVCEVFFLDYGNRETITIKDIHSMDIGFTKYPQFGVLCAFENCSPKVPEDKLRSLMLENSFQFRMIRKENDKWFVSLVENFPGNVAVLELLRQNESTGPRSILGAGLGGFQEQHNSQPPKSDSWRNENQNVQSYSKNEIRKPFVNQEPQRNKEVFVVPEKRPEPTQEFVDYSSISVPPNAYRNVYISHVISPSEFYCQIEEDSSKLTLLMKTVEDTYAHPGSDLNFSDFPIGSPCCAIFEDGAWYRGRIKQISGNNCDVFFVDYGNTDSVPQSKVKKLQIDLFRWPSQAICCKSYNISPKSGEWSEDEINAFINMTLDKSFVAQFVECDKSGVYAVNLVSIGKLQHDIFNKEFVDLGYGRLQDSKKCLVLNSHAASNNLTFSSPNVEVGSSEPVEVVYGLNPGEIFCQLKSYSKEFKQMMVNLQEYYNKVSEAESLIDRPHQGMICVAKFFLDSAWYRAEIKKVEANKIVVFYVDYGNSETVERKKVRCIMQDFTLLPIQAIKCRIQGIKPPGKSWTVNKNLGKYFEGDAICKFISKEKDFYLVDIKCNQRDVAQSLVSDGFALSDYPEIKPIVSNKSELQDSSFKLPERDNPFVLGQLIPVTVSFIESPGKFWCQLVDDVEILEDLMANIEAEISNIPAVNGMLKVGILCIAQYYEDEAWYRAQVKSCQPENSYEVFFVDYGNSETVSMSQIRTMPAQFRNLPPQCFECNLQNTPLSVTSEMTTLFRGLIDEAEEITAKIEQVSSTSYTVTLLFDRDDQEINISEMLFGVEEVEMSAVVQEPPRFLPPDVPLGLQDGYVSIVNSPQDFYIQLAGTEDALSDLSAALADICESSAEENLEGLCIGFACCARFSEDNNWYRAEITAVHDSTVDVLFVDYGNTDTVLKSSLRSLSSKHLEMPPLAIKCKLNGIVPVTDEWSEDVINIFQEMVDDSCLGITFISKDIPATVNIAKDDKEITQCLVDMELASVETCTETDEAYAEDHLTAPIEDPLSSLPNDQSYPQRKLSSTSFVVKICYVDSYDKFYVMPLELSTELDTVMTTLDILYASSDKTESENSHPAAPEVLEDPKTAMPCVAKYSEDGAWYRAIITDIDGDNIYVTFVDYGNSEITSLGNLRPLTPELVKIPPIALECTLFGIEAVPGQEQEISAKLEEYFVDEVELEMEIVEASPYKIRLNYNGDIASMLIKEGLANEKPSPVDVETGEMFADNSKMTFVDESLEYKIQISKRFITGTDKIIGNVKFCELENDLIAFHVVSTDLEDELHNLQQRLQDAYANPPQNLSYVSCMDFCAAKYMEDENWYRAQVLSLEKEKVKVRFIDYGNCETVDKSDIYELLSDFSVEPQFSVKCILFELKVKKNKEVELQNRLDEYVYHEPVELKLCIYSHAVCDPCITKVICGDVDISELILNEKLVSQQFIINTQLDSRFKATIERIEGDIIYVLPSHFVEEREKFQCRLQEDCKDLSILSSDVVCDYLYAAKIDDTWYRVSVIDSSSIVVNAVDFGFSRNISKADLVLLPSDFCHQFLFLVPCTIVASEASDANKVEIQDLNAGAIISCELLRINMNVKPFKIKVLEVGVKFKSNAEQSIEKTKETEVTDVMVTEEDVKDTESSPLHNVEQAVDDAHCEESQEEFLDVKLKNIEEYVQFGNAHSKENVEETVVGDASYAKEDFEETSIPSHSVNEQAGSDVQIEKEQEELVESQNEPETCETEIKTADDNTNVPESVVDNPLNENLEEQRAECFEDKPKTDEEQSVEKNKLERQQEEYFESKSETEVNYVEETKQLEEVQQEERFEARLENNEEESAEKTNQLGEEQQEQCFDAKYENDKEKSIEKNKQEEQRHEVCVETKFENEEKSVEKTKRLEEEQQEECFEAKLENNEEEPIEKTKQREECFESKSETEVNYVEETKQLKEVQQEERFEAKLENNEEESAEKTNQLKEVCFDGNVADSFMAEKDVFDDAELNNIVKSIDIEEIEKDFEEDDFDIQNSIADESPNYVTDILKETNSNITIDTEWIGEDEKSMNDVHSVESHEVETEVKNILDSVNNSEKDNNVCDFDSVNTESKNYDVSSDMKNNSGNQVVRDINIVDNLVQRSDNVEDESKNEELITYEAKDTNACDIELDVTTGDSCSAKSSPEKNACINDKSFVEVKSEEFEDENNGTILHHYKLSGSVQVQVSDITVSDGSIIFAVQPLKLQEDFSLLKESMQKHYSSESENFDENCETSFCAILYENEWCRGKILQKGEDTWTILLIDYGKWVSIIGTEVKALINEHCNLSPFAVWCILGNAVCSDENSEVAKEFLYDKVRDSNAVIKILEGGEPYKIDLFVNDSNILNQLLREGLVSQRLPNLYLQNGSYKAKFSFLNVTSDSTEIFVNLCTFLDDYRYLAESMGKSYDVKDSVSKIVESGLYAVYHKSSWFRGVAISSDAAQVFLVDVGETVTNSTSLCFLLPEHCLQPCYAVQCHLPFSISVTNSDISESLQNILLSKDFFVDLDICPDTNAVSALLTDESVISELKDLGLVCNDVTESGSNVENNITSRGTSPENSPNKSTPEKIPEQESSERLVGYLQETFTTKPL